MAKRDGWQLWGGFWTTSLGTLASRVLGLVRDMATAALLGLGESGVMDAFAIAFRIPNLPRRILGEGALAASFLPLFTRQFERSPAAAWQLLSVLFAWLTIVLLALVLIGEAICAWIWSIVPGDSAASQLSTLSATMFPYAIFICLAAQASAALQARLEFRWPAFAPTLLNVCWLIAVWELAPRVTTDKWGQARVIAVAVVISGVLQFTLQLAALARLGFRFNYNWPASRDAFWEVMRSMLPIALGMAVTQLNTLLDSLIAWVFSDPRASQPIVWLGGAVSYPMQTGAAAAIYYGERFYQLPVGLLGIAMATVIYPLVSRHAARGDRNQLGIDLSLALRIVWFTALPAGIGMMLVAGPLVRLLFERGEFSAEDAARAAGMIACYASGVWAYAAIPVLVRGYYALGDRATPARVGLAAVALNLVLNLALIWPLAERGLAVATSISAATQVVLLTAIFTRSRCRLRWEELVPSLMRSTLAVFAMAVVVVGIQRAYPADAAASRGQLMIQVALSIGFGIVAYLAMARMLGMHELRLLFWRPKGVAAPIESEDTRP